MRKFYPKTIVVLLFFLTFQLASGRTYYVATNGNDSNPGTINQPWGTWARALNASEVNPGDTVMFRGGTYYKKSNLNSSWYYPERYPGAGYKISVRGNSDNWIVFMAYPGEEPVLDSDNIVPTKNSNFGVRSSVRYVKFIGLAIRNVWSVQGGLNGSSVQCYGWEVSGNVIFENCKGYNIHGIAFETYGGNMYYKNCDAWNCSDIYAMPPQLPGNRGTGFASIVMQNTSSTITYENCRAWDCGDQGFSMYNVGFVTADGCWSMFNGDLQGGGHGFKTGFTDDIGEYSSNKRLIKNCIAAFNRDFGMDQNTNDRRAIPALFYNNIAYGNGVGFIFFNTRSPNSIELMQIIKNNISYNNDDYDWLAESGSITTDEYNSWNKSFNPPITDSDFEAIYNSSTARSLLTAPRKEDGSLPDLQGFLQLSSTSRFIDAGVDVGLPFNGNAPDLGAFESGQQVNGNFLPTVVITTPTTGTHFGIGESILISANANDIDGSITKVEFFNGGSKLGEKTSSPWTYNWSNVPEGDYSISAKATDNSGASVTSSPITVHVTTNTPPIISITSPADGSEFPDNFDITITTNSSDPDGSVVKVEFFNGTNKIGESNSAPWSFTWNNVPTGDYNINALATDNMGGQTRSSSRFIRVRVLDNIKPQVTITSPGEGDDFMAPATITLSMNAQDPDGSISLIEYFVNGEKFGMRNNRESWSYDWSNVPPGSYLMSAQATDNAGEISEATPVAITVGNIIPTVQITSPSAGAENSAPAELIISANVEDENGTINKVEFYNGTSKLGEKYSPPWSFTWNNVPEGEYNLIVTATDNYGDIGSSSPQNVSVNSPTGENLKPTITITSPADGEKFISPASITLHATAQDPDGSISKIEYFVNGEKFGQSDDLEEWSYNWNVIETGTYILTATTTDNEGSTSSATPVTIQVENNTSPTVEIVSPSNGSTYSANSDITITVNAGDSDGEISKLEFFEGETKLFEKTHNPWTYTWSNVPPGEYSLIATATDDYGDSESSAPVNVTVSDSQNENQEPVVSITSPADGERFKAPSSVTLSMNAQDPDGSISKIEYFVNFVRIGESENSNDWSYNWNVSEAGTYTMTATATDNEGLNSSATPVTIVVEPNNPPFVEIVSPEDGSTVSVHSNITITVNAEDDDGEITKIEFFEGNIKLGEKTSNPWSYTWYDVPIGVYDLTAVATDNLGGTASSNIHRVKVKNNNPTVNINSRSGIIKFRAPANIPLLADAEDIDGSIKKVEFYNGNKKIGESVSTPYELEWDDVPSGKYTLKAIATDDMDATGISAPLNIEVVPDVSINPNPNTGIFEIILTDHLISEESVFRIISIDGKIIYEGIIYREELFKQINLPYINPGIYIFSLSEEDQVVMKKFIKQ